MGEMAQKAKRDGERSPSEKIPGVALISGVEKVSISGAPSSVAAAVSSQERPPIEKKNSGGENLSPNELLDLEQQKLAGKKKGSVVFQGWKCYFTPFQLPLWC